MKKFIDGYDFYYLQNLERGLLGNAPIWWQKGNGYTPYLERALPLYRDFVVEKMKDNPEKWQAYPCELIKKRCHIVIDTQDFPHLENKPAVDWQVVDVSEII